MIFVDECKEYSLRQMIIFWSKRLIEAIEENDMAAAYDIQTNTLLSAGHYTKKKLATVS